MQIKTALRYHYLLRWLNKKLVTIPNAGEHVQKMDHSHRWWECQIARPLWKTVWWFLMKLNIQLPCKLIIALLGIYPRERQTYIHIKICTWMFIVVLFKVDKSEEHPLSENLNEWYVYARKYYSSVKKEWIIGISNNLKESSESCAVWRKPEPKAYIIRDFICMTFWKWQTS